MCIQEKHKTQGPHQGECIGLPIAMGYLDAPPAGSAARRGRAINLVSKSSYVNQISWCGLAIISCLYLVCFCALCLFVYAIVDMNDPGLKIEHVSVSLERNNLKSDDNPVTTKWNIAFSVENSNLFSPNNFCGLDVYVLCMYPTSSVMIHPPFSQDPRNTTFLNATVEALLPHRYLSASIRELEFDVILRAKYVYWYPYRTFIKEIVCRGMSVGFSWNAGKGIMVRWPGSCSSIRGLMVRGPGSSSYIRRLIW